MICRRSVGNCRGAGICTRPDLRSAVQAGTQLLERASPLAGGLTDEERSVAANAFRMFSMRLGMLGHAEQAEHFKAKAQELAEL